MDNQRKLKTFKEKFNIEIEKQLNERINSAEYESEIIKKALMHVKKMILSGGKRVRPAFMYYGYLGVGGKKKKEILEASVSIELIHTYLLIHDDIMDRDNRRHGVDSVHWKYQKLGRMIFKKKNCEHFGNSMAIIIGDMIGALGNQVLFNSKFDAKDKINALIKLQSIVAWTVDGQAKDIYMEYSEKPTEKDVLTMYKNKTAKYTVEGPLQLGATLGGASEKTLKKLSEVAIPLGIAFQIQDDILGVFGGNHVGKPLGSDIKEGKQTLMVIKALELANKEDKKFLEEKLGSDKITKKELTRIQQIISDSGSLNYTKKMLEDLLKKGKKKIENLDFNKESKDFLREIADYLGDRDI